MFSKRYKLACVPFEDSDQPAHSHSLDMTIAVDFDIHVIMNSGFPRALEIMEKPGNHEKKSHAWKNHGI